MTEGATEGLSRVRGPAPPRRRRVREGGGADCGHPGHVLGVDTDVAGGEDLRDSEAVVLVNKTREQYKLRL